MAERKNNLRVVRRFNRRRCICRGQSIGLLDENMLADRSGPDDLFSVLGMRRCQDNRIDVGIAEHGLVIFTKRKTVLFRKIDRF